MTGTVEIARRLCGELAGLEFGSPVAYVYNPLEYAWEAHRSYLERYGSHRPRRVVVFGMNPGPWGMAQTGIPFGEVVHVRDWLGIRAPVGRPRREHPKRPVLGLQCPRREVSGRRLWGWARETFGTPERFFEHIFVANYCPLLFLEEGGRNRTPDRLPAGCRAPLLAACDRALRDTIRYFEPRVVIALGRFAEARAREALKEMDLDIRRVLHPSPANPAANRGWGEAMSEALRGAGVLEG